MDSIAKIQGRLIEGLGLGLGRGDSLLLLGSGKSKQSHRGEDPGSVSTQEEEAWPEHRKEEDEGLGKSDSMPTWEMTKTAL